MKNAAVLVVVVALLGIASLVARRAPPARPAPPPLPEQTLLFNAQGQAQAYNLSCESRSASDLAKFWGRDVAEDEFLKRLPRADNPHRGFIGLPDDPPGGLPPKGYGVYAEPVAELLNQYGLPARAESGRGLAWLRGELAAGRPVIVWSTYDFKPRQVQVFKDKGGQDFKAVPFEHTYLAVGYSPQGFYALDALDGQRKFYTNAEFEAGWNQLDEMAVAVQDPKTVAAGPGRIIGPLTTFGVPVLAVGLLVVAYVTWQNNRASGGRSRHRVGQRAPRQPQAVPRAASATERFQRTAVGMLQNWTGARADSEMDYGRAKSLGTLGLAVGLLLAVGLGRFNPCVAVPIVGGCGIAGVALGYELERRAHRAKDRGRPPYSGPMP